MLLTDKKERTEEELRTCAEDAGIKVYPMAEFYMETPLRAKRKAAVILGYGALSQEDIVDGLHALRAAYHI